MPGDPSSSDDVLLEAARAGDKVAHRALFLRHFSAVRSVVARLRDEVADDIMQSTFLVLCQPNQGNYTGKGSLPAFLRGVAHKLMFKYFRESVRVQRLADKLTWLPVDPARSARGALIDEEQRRLLAAAVRRLDFDAQLVVFLGYWENLTMAEVAEVLEIPEGTVKSRLNRARSKLRVALEAAASSPELAETTVRSLDSWASGLGLQFEPGS